VSNPNVLWALSLACATTGLGILWLTARFLTRRD
jgi:hypothetical protein